MLKIRLVIAFILFSIQQGCWANLSIQPVRVAIPAHQNIAVIKVQNKGQSPVSIQLDLKQWGQENSKDTYTDTPLGFVTPKIATIAPLQTQIIRVALRTKIPRQKEDHYRLFVTEIVPNRYSKPNESNLKIALKIAIPIFALPSAVRTVDYLAKVDMIKNQQAVVTIDNKSNVHLMGSEIQLTDEKGQFLGEIKQLIYVLPYSRYTWRVILNRAVAKENITISSNVSTETIPAPAI